MTETDSALLAMLTGAAARVPSFGSGRPPWRFRHRRGLVELVLAPPVVDGPDAERSLRLAVLSAASALFNLRLAIGHHGYEPRIETDGDATPGAVLARIGPGRRRSPIPDDERLHAASIQHGSGVSGVSGGPPETAEVDDHDLGKVVDAALRASTADLEIIEPYGAALTALDTAMAGGDATGGWHPSRTGTPVRSLVVATPCDDPAAWLATGQAIQAMRLEAFCLGLGARTGVPPDQGRFNRGALGQIIAPGHLIQVAIQLEPVSVDW